MTAREQAEIHIFGQIVGKEIGDALIDGDVRRLTETIQSAILAEREACAKAMDQQMDIARNEALKAKEKSDEYTVKYYQGCHEGSHRAQLIIRAHSNAPETEKEITVKMPSKGRQAGVFTPDPTQTIDPKESIAPDPGSA